MGDFVFAHRGSAGKRAEFTHQNKKNPTPQDNAAYYMTRRNKFSAEEARKLGAESYAQLLQMHEDIMNLPQIDLNDAEAVRSRIQDYFDIMKKYKNKPTLAGLALSLGTNRDKMKRMATNASGKYTQEVSEEIQKVYVVYESLWESYMLNGDVPPLNGIFIGKNQFGYKDVVEQNQVVEVRPQIDTEAIRMKYIGADNELPGSTQQED